MACATRSADGRYRAAVATFQQAELDLIQATKQAYADLQQAQEAVTVNEETYKIARSFTDLAQRQFQAGAVPETNVIRTGIDQANAEQNLKVPGVGFAEWGPGDMALSLGVRGPGNVAEKDPKMLAARARVFAACKANKIFFLNSMNPTNVSGGNPKVGVPRCASCQV